MAAMFSGFKFKFKSAEELRRDIEEEQRNTPVPCRWPDVLPSGVEADNNDPARPADRVEYGVLSVHLFSLTANVQGKWKVRATLGQDGLHTEFDLRTWPVLDSGVLPFWLGPHTILRLDMSLSRQPCEPTLRLFLERHKDSDQSPKGNEVMDLRSIKLGPFSEPCTNKMETYKLKDTAAEVRMEATFSRAQLTPMTKHGYENRWTRHESWDLGGLELVESRWTDASYLMATICANDYRKGSANISLENPWIAPVRFVYKSPGRLHLMSHISSDRHLLGHVQSCRRLSLEEARLYTAQIVCALGSLHDIGIVGLLSSENVLLDVFGNISIVTPRLFTTDQSCCLDQLAYPVPEIVNGDVLSQLTDWWILGAFLYEMLTGLPPFYDVDSAERSRNVLNQELTIPVYIQGATANILRRLLEKQPAERLGARGVSEIKEHDFFQVIDWHHPLSDRTKLLPFQPHHTWTVFSNSPSRFRDTSSTGPPSPPMKIIERGGYLCEEIDFGGPSKAERMIGRPRRSSDIFQPVLEQEQQVPLSREQEDARAIQADAERKGSELEAVMARLKAALQTGQSEDLVAHILDSCADDIFATFLKSAILINQPPLSGIAPEPLWAVPITALEWAVELGRADLVVLLLSRGADPSFTFDEVYGPGMTRAAREQRTELVDILAPKTSRILALQSPCLAVEQRDIPTITCLLSHRVPCDFDPEDHHLPPPLTSEPDGRLCGTERFSWEVQPAWRLSPLARATGHGDVAIVCQLLTHGADPNTPYHSMFSASPDSRSLVDAGFSCGRVVQLAMHLGHRDVVDALLEGGADIWLPHPEWLVPGHVCRLTPRSDHLRVMAGLKEAARDGASQ